MTADESELGMITNCPDCAAEITIAKPDENSRPDRILVTSGDLKTEYEVKGTVFFSVGTRGGLASEFNRLREVHAPRLAIAKKRGQISKSVGVGQVIGGIGVDSQGDIDLEINYSGASFKSNDLDIAFQIVVGELQLRASFLAANAVIGFRYNIELDSNGNVVNFFANGYGTAVRIL